MAHTIQEHLARFVLGQSAFSISAINNKFENNVARNEMAKGILDQTLYDLAARCITRPLHDLIGGSQLDRIPMSMVLPLTEVEQVLAMVQLGQDRGIRSFRCKLGDGLNKDVEIISAVRDQIGPDAALRVDYNQAYNPNEALACIEAIAPYKIDFAEQPVRADDFVGMAWVQARTEVPIMAHESAFGLRDIITLAEMGAVRAVGINPERPGGITNALKAIDYAAAKGLDVVLHNQPSGIGSATILHLHTARADKIRHATELQGHVMLEHDLIQERLTYADGYAQVPSGPGLGVELDLDAVERYATHAPIIMQA